MLEFKHDWKQWQQIPFNEKRIERILLNPEQWRMPGPLKKAIKDRNQTVYVISGVHRDGAPGTSRVDPQPHITLSYNNQTYHVRLTLDGGILEVTT